MMRVMARVVFFVVLVAIVSADYAQDYSRARQPGRFHNQGNAQDEESWFESAWQNMKDELNQLVDETTSRTTQKPAPQQGLVPDYRLYYGQYDFKHYPTSGEVQEHLQMLAWTHKQFVRTFSIGKSHEGRDIMAIRISNGNEGNPVLLIDGGIHAREWISPTTALYAIEMFINDRLRGNFYRNIDIIIIPLLNPDGYEHSRKFDKNWRKNRYVNPDSPNCPGVDLNRNFDFYWNDTSQSKNPCDEIYPGKKPFSEPESRALRDFMWSLKNKTRVHLTLHSAIETIMYPWGIRTSQTLPNRDLHKCLAGKAANLSPVDAFYHSNYRYGSIVDIVDGPASGSTVDWSVTSGGSTTAFCIELPGRGYGFHPPEKHIAEIGYETYQHILVFARFAATGTC